MNTYNVSNKNIILTNNHSKGFQAKYLKDGFWYKTDAKGYEGISEHLTSILLKNTNITNFVEYESCTIYNTDTNKTVTGCRSKNFLKADESLITFQKLFNIYHGGNLSEYIMKYDKVEDRIHFVIDFIKEYTSVDVSNYLKNILILDMLTLNGDRHFSNLALIVNDNGIFKEGPIFDNGDSFLSDIYKYPTFENIEDNIKKVSGAPFSGSLELQAIALNMGLDVGLNIQNFLEELNNISTKTRIKKVINYQMNRYFPKEYKKYIDKLKIDDFER